MTAPQLDIKPEAGPPDKKNPASRTQGVSQMHSTDTSTTRESTICDAMAYIGAHGEALSSAYCVKAWRGEVDIQADRSDAEHLIETLGVYLVPDMDFTREGRRFVEYIAHAGEGYPSDLYVKLTLVEQVSA